MKHRRAYLVFPEKHGIDPSLLQASKLLAGLNISFSMQITAAVGESGNANITVYNLNRDDMGFLSTCAAKWKEQKSLIQLYVGYEDDDGTSDIKCIFSGWITQASPEGYPDLALNIKGITGREWWGNRIDISKVNTSIIDLIDYTSSVTGYPVNIQKYVRDSNVLLNKKLENFSYSGTSWGLLDKIQEMIGGGFTPNKDAVFLSTYNDQTFIWTEESSSTGNILYVSEKSGMIGIPEATTLGVNVRVLLNINVNIGDKIRLKSVRMPILDGDYTIASYSHTGELRGNTWETTLCCQRAANIRTKNEGSLTEGLGL